MSKTHIAEKARAAKAEEDQEKEIRRQQFEKLHGEFGEFDI
jgi:hypothetical protein